MTQRSPCGMRKFGSTAPRRPFCPGRRPRRVGATRSRPLRTSERPRTADREPCTRSVLAPFVLSAGASPAVVVAEKPKDDIQVGVRVVVKGSVGIEMPRRGRFWSRGRSGASSLKEGQSSGLHSTAKNGRAAGGTTGKRSALPNAKILIHQLSAGFEGQATDIEIQAREIINVKRRLEEILAQHTRQPLERVSKD